MNALTEGLQLVLAMSWRAGLLILLLLALQRLARGKIPEQVMFIGWIVVGFRLLIPFGVPTAWSPYNLAKPIPAVESMARVISPRPGIERTSGMPSIALEGRQNHAWSPLPTFATIWAAGAAAMLLARIREETRFRRRLRILRSKDDPRVAELVQRCAEHLAAPDSIPVLTTEAVRAPALYGIFRPQLLLPSGFAEKLTDNELRLVVLHELGHWRRRDMLVQLLLQAGRMLHWFNPLVWLAARLARLDCELACDEFVLRRGTPPDGHAYGATLLKVLGTVRGPARTPCGLGILENSHQLKLRIRMIVSYHASATWRLAGAIVLSMLAVASITHESLAQNVVEKAAAVITSTPPAQWSRASANRWAAYEVGVDNTQPFRQPNSVFVKSLSSEKADYCGLAQACAAKAFLGKRVRFSVWMKTEDVQGRAGIWLRVDGFKRHGLQYDNMKNRPVKGTTPWTCYSTVMDVPVDAVSLNYGFSVVEGSGRAWFNDPKLEVACPDLPSTNLVTTPPGPCPNPNCTSGICKTPMKLETLANSSFADSPKR